jgi:hypothetical protein
MSAMSFAEPPSKSPALVWWAGLALLIAVLLIPLFVTEIPPLLDYPNHLARMAILADRGDPALARIYGVDWRIVPNIGIDIAMPAVMRLLPLYAAGKIFVALALLLPLIGVVALHRAVFRTASWWPLAAGLVAYNRLFFTGFLNFLIGAGLALLAAALWERLRDRAALRVGSAIVIAVLIFFCHLIALAFYGLLLLGLEAGRAGQARRIDLRRLLLLAIPFAIPAALYLSAPIGQGGDGPHGLVDAIRRYYWSLAAEPPGLKLYGLMGPFLTYDRMLDFGAAALTVLVLAAFAVGRRLQFAAGLAGAGALLLILYPATPFFMMATAWVDQRLPILAGFILFAATRPIAAPRRTGVLMIAAFAAAIAGRTAEIAAAWSRHDAELADFRQVIAPVMPGDKVLVVQAERNDDPAAMVNRPDTVRAMRDNDSTMHLPGLLVAERHAFWPLLFTAATKQPVRVNPPYDAIALPEGELPWIGFLAAPGPEALQRAPYLSDWQDTFDWVLVMRPAEAAHGYDLLPDRLAPASSGRIAALYRVRR